MNPRRFTGLFLLLLAFFLVGAGQAPISENAPEEGIRFQSLTVPSGTQKGFTVVPPEFTGINFSNRVEEISMAANRLLEIGSGVALGDVDGDGWVDVYFGRTEGDNVLYRNLGGWKFEDITVRSGTACPNQYTTLSLIHI